MGLTVTDVVTSFGAYINSGQSEKNIHAAFMRPELALMKVFKTIPTENEVERSVLVTQTRVAQAFKRKWSPLGGTTFKPHAIPLFNHKLDEEIYPDDIEKSWLAFLAGAGIDRKEWPIGRYIAEKFLLPQYMQDIEMNERIAGVYAAPADNNTPAAAGTAMNGVKKIIQDHVTAGLITPFATGALSATPATFVGQVQNFVKSIDPTERRFVKYVNIPMSKMDDWKDGMQTLYNGQFLSEANLLKVRNQNVEVNFVDAQDGTNLIWATVEDNAVRYVKRAGNAGKLQYEAEDRKVKIFTDHWEGLGFNVPQFVYVNDAGIA